MCKAERHGRPYLKEVCMETGPLYVGIDVSKAQLDVAERPSGERAVIPHTEQDIAALVEQLGARRPACVVLEATGGLQAPLGSALAIAGISVAVVNPPAGARFCQSHRPVRQDGRDRCTDLGPLCRGSAASPTSVAG